MKAEHHGSNAWPLLWMGQTEAVHRPKQYAQRQTRRYQQRLQVTAINGDAAGDSAVLDISAAGLKLQTSRPLAMNDLVEVTCLMPLTGEERRLAGKVVWLKALPPFGQRFLVGLRFFKTEWDITVLARQWEKADSKD